MKKQIRNIAEPIIWNGDLNDDCTAKWCGLMLRAEWMDEDYWWWCVYDLLDNENQIDSSNEYDQNFTGGETARNKAEEVAINYLKKELICNQVGDPEKIDIGKLISDLKILRVSPGETIMTLVKDFNIEYGEAKNQVFDSPLWKGLREQSETLTQAFLDIGAEDADEVEIVDGRVTSITFDLTKDNLENEKEDEPQTFWKKLKSRFKK